MKPWKKNSKSIFLNVQTKFSSIINFHHPLFSVNKNEFTKTVENTVKTTEIRYKKKYIDLYFTTN